ncbi:Uncharacterized protein, similar to the N-terminal domain of Lon protease [hydrothermal vent metagenome]|uniref:Uncharacterized protein, similar to the N-terminal domain of Lon protease n=1 Tax=hydrothermal vent metagenome TaxID=652676 RepID=A0A3B0U2L4_9ZZZZ
MTEMGDRRTSLDDLPATAPVFPLPGAILLPRRELPLNIFEPRYLAMVDASLAGDRMIGMVQPQGNGKNQHPKLESVGGLGRITAFSERADGTYVICLTGLCRFRIAGEREVATPYRQCALDYNDYQGDLIGGKGAEAVDRTRLLAAFTSYLDAKSMEADWDEIARSDNETLVNALTMISPFGTAEKQALLEASDLATRADFLVALTEMALAQEGNGSDYRTRTH